MHPSQSFNKLSQEWKEGDPTPHQSDVIPAISYNCLTVHWANGEEMTFYYPFLMSVRLFLAGEHNLIVLRFTSERLILKGYSLKPLKRLFAREKPSDIFVCDQRYLMPGTAGQPIVIEAVVEERKG
ncbi:hypothetical protein A4D02_30805 [Niastella koreensis]|uniref:Uncharacterized protein n=2 Tax=Niastella koreensis TaxID=354356 RepID=G8T8Z0_NIAKG|nr:hypothetical protein Niako_6122 [Niastella koreensis GR20-10]OQP46433.1 hypothetical protein A4D02_30805 [Niastella koreensis]